MNTRIMLFLAVAAMANASTTLGQSIQQLTDQNGPTNSLQQWTNPSMGPNGQQGMAQNTAYANNAFGNATGNVGCDTGNGNGSCGTSCGLGRSCGAYDPRCPTKYFSIFGGASAFQDINYSIDLDDGRGGALGIDAILGTETGWALGGAVGRSIGRKMRVELGFVYRTASVESGELAIGGQPNGAIDLDGSLNMYSSMTNLLYDFCPKSRFNPYVGLGAGVVFQDLEVVEPTIPLSVNLKDSSWAYQGIVGISSCLNSRTDLFVEYRYFGTDELSLDVGTPIGSASFTTDTTSNDVLFGLRIKRF